MPVIPTQAIPFSLLTRVRAKGCVLLMRRAFRIEDIICLQAGAARHEVC